MRAAPGPGGARSRHRRLPEAVRENLPGVVAAFVARIAPDIGHQVAARREAAVIWPSASWKASERWEGSAYQKPTGQPVLGVAFTG